MSISEYITRYREEGSISKNKQLIDYENELVHLTGEPAFITTSNMITVNVNRETNLSLTYTLDSVRVNIHERGKTSHIYTSTGFDYDGILNDLVSIFQMNNKNIVSTFISINRDTLLEVMSKEGLCDANKES